MNQSQTNRITMFKTVASVLDDHNSIWSGMPAFATAVQHFKEKIGAINTVAQKQDAAMAGAVADKATARDDLEDVLFLTCEALGVLGHTSNDNELSDLAAVTRSDLRNSGDEELLIRATNILQRANARKTELAALLVTQENIDELAQALQAFQGTKEKPRLAATDRAVQTESLPSLILDASGILRNQIDRLVNLFSRSNAEFVSRYGSARVIIDRAASHSQTKTAGSAPKPNA